MTFFGGEVDDDSRMRFMDGASRSERIRERAPPILLLNTAAMYRFKRSTDAVATTMLRSVRDRPEMCRDYAGRMYGPFGVAYCLSLNPVNPAPPRIASFSWKRRKGSRCESLKDQPNLPCPQLKRFCLIIA